MGPELQAMKKLASPMQVQQRRSHTCVRMASLHSVACLFGYYVFTYTFGAMVVASVFGGATHVCGVRGEVPMQQVLLDLRKTV